MAEISQSIRYAISGDPVNNPNALYDFIKPGRIVFEARPPNDGTDGENLWNWIDTTSGVWYQKANGAWDGKFVIGGGGPPSGINGATNVGGGADVFRSVVGTDLTFRTLISSDTSNEIIQNADTLDIQARPACVNFSGVGAARATDAVLGKTIVLREFISSDNKVGISTPNNNQLDFVVQNLTKDDVGLNWVGNYRNGVGATSFAPDANTDSTEGFIQGSYFAQQSEGLKVYFCTDDTPGAAVWQLVYDGSSSTVFEKDCINSATLAGLSNTVVQESFQLFNIGNWITVANRGSWAYTNSGFGPINIQRTAATDGKSNNILKVDYTVQAFTTDTLAGRSRTLVVAWYRSDLSSPYLGSEFELAFAASPTGSVNVYAECSGSFLIQTFTSGAVELVPTFRYPDHSVGGDFTFRTTVLQATITQV